MLLQTRRSCYSFATKNWWCRKNWCFVVTCIRCLLANWVLTQFKLQLVNGTNILIRFTDTEGPGVFTRTHMWFTENPTSTKSLLLQSPNLPDIFHKKFLQFTQWNILSVSVRVLRKFQLLNQLLRMHMTAHKNLVQIRLQHQFFTEEKPRWSLVRKNDPAKNMETTAIEIKRTEQMFHFQGAVESDEATT